jgi:hypothetical protein
MRGGAAVIASPETPVDIWVAAGTYRPDQSRDVGPLTASPYCPPYGDCDKTRSFYLLDHVAIYGGFAGGETDFQERDVQANVTILSGDLAEAYESHTSPVPGGKDEFVGETFGGKCA